MNDLLPRRWSTWLPVGALALVAVFPLVSSNGYVLSLLNFGLVALLLALSMIVLLGYAGQISLGQAAFYGLGAYTSAILTTMAGLPFWVGLVAGPAVSGGLAYVVSRRISHLEPFYLAIATLVVGFVAQTVFAEWDGVTGGPNGLTSVPGASLFGYEFATDSQFFYLALAFAVAALYCAARLDNSRIGRALRSVKGDEAAAASMGVNVAAVKARAFALSGTLCGLAGVLYAHYVRFISPETFGLTLSIDVVVLAIVGGVGRWPGAILGAAFLTLLPEWLRAYPDLSEVIYGGALFLCLLVFPGGLLGIGQAWLRKFSTFSRRAPAAGSLRRSRRTSV